MHYWKSFIWLFAIIVLSLTPGEKFKNVELFEFSDIIVHFGLYFILSVLIMIDFNIYIKVSTKKILYNLLFCILIGGLLEILQLYLIKNRTGSISDFIANALGAIFGVLVIFLFRKKLKVISL